MDIITTSKHEMSLGHHMENHMYLNDVVGQAGRDMLCTVSGFSEKSDEGRLYFGDG